MIIKESLDKLDKNPKSTDCRFFDMSNMPTSDTYDLNPFQHEQPVCIQPIPMEVVPVEPIPIQSDQLNAIQPIPVEPIPVEPIPIQPANPNANSYTSNDSNSDLEDWMIHLKDLENGI